eukprot:CAMPEP_0198662760 /NCGR_PEP_ID=MMETSP1467-20131203/49084_1 /TAXON_ID=1462469 /ORGANISM="unid. sp., Strain CCMP2135" /LENGTH=200 /DNA_ID=CAMNT_0044399263 /DNA_START=80 /DNA_END=679 /DNA_ORIENTATION=-
MTGGSSFSAQLEGKKTRRGHSAAYRSFCGKGWRGAPGATYDQVVMKLERSRRLRTKEELSGGGGRRRKRAPSALFDDETAKRRGSRHLAHDGRSGRVRSAALLGRGAIDLGDGGDARNAEVVVVVVLEVGDTREVPRGDDAGRHRQGLTLEFLEGQNASVVAWCRPARCFGRWLAAVGAVDGAPPLPAGARVDRAQGPGD